MDTTTRGRPRDRQLDAAILCAARELLMTAGYGDLSMEAVAARAGVGKKTLYRRWPSKAALVTESVLDAYGRGGSFEVPNTGDVRADLRSWLVEHAEFLGEVGNAALIRALIAAAAVRPVAAADLRQRLGVPQHDGLLIRLRSAVTEGALRADVDLNALADAMIGTLLLRALAMPVIPHPTQFDGLLDALLHSNLTHTGTSH